MRNGKRLGLFAIAALLASGCEGRASTILDTLAPAPIDPASPPLAFSAPAMLVLSLGANTSPGEPEPPACPARTESGDTTTLTGGCIDEDGAEWYGRVTFPTDLNVAATNVSGAVVYEGFGSDSAAGCADRPDGRRRQLIDGRVTITRTDARLDYDIDLATTTTGVGADCSNLDEEGGLRYTGQALTPTGGGQTWSGSGTFGSDRFGRYDLVTEDELIDGTRCEHEPLSGTTTVTGMDVVVVTYDGATDCDEEGTVTWTLNGVDQGERSGIRCSASPGARGSFAAALVVFGLCLAGLRRRR